MSQRYRTQASPERNEERGRSDPLLAVEYLQRIRQGIIAQTLAEIQFG